MSEVMNIGKIKINRGIDAFIMDRLFDHIQQHNKAARQLCLSRFCFHEFIETDRIKSLLPHLSHHKQERIQEFMFMGTKITRCYGLRYAYLVNCKGRIEYL